MKRRLAALLVVLFAACALFVAQHYAPRRDRVEGWRTPWASLPLETESVWSLQATRRDAILKLFFEANDELAHCNAEYFRGTESTPAQLELLVDVKQGSVQFMYVIASATPEAALPAGALACVERALENAKPFRHPALANVDVRWRMGVTFLFHPPLELPPTHWWDRFVPDAWRSGGNSAIHVG